MTEPAEAAQITPAALERWSALSTDVPLQLSLTRADLDNLLLGLRTLAIGQNELATALSAHLNQDPEACMEAVMRSGELAQASFARINAFISAVMATAAPASRG